MPEPPTPTVVYHLARDASEAERLKLQHEVMLSCQGYYIHPDIDIPPSGKDYRIAELATGSTIFLCEVASALSLAECHGFDISDKMYPGAADLPNNVQLHVADMKQPFEQRWLGYFDFVHIRLVHPAMGKADWATVLRNIVSLLKPGGWVQWVEDDIGHAVRHTARPVAPSGAATKALAATAAIQRQSNGYVPPHFSVANRLIGQMIDNERADAMIYGYMNLHTLMEDPEVGNLQKVGRDIYPVDRENDNGKLRSEWCALGAAAISSMLRAREQDGVKGSDLGADDFEKGYIEDMAKGAYWLVKMAVFTGQKR